MTTQGGRTVVDLSDWTRDEKLLFLAAVESYTMENSGSGHNTAWGEGVDLILSGRRGLFDYSDAELDQELRDFFENYEPEEGDLLFRNGPGMPPKDVAIQWARRISFIGKVDGENSTWDEVPVDEQERWLLPRAEGESQDGSE